MEGIALPVALAGLVLLTSVASEASLARGFGDHLDWKTQADGLAEAKESGKPIMMLIHKSWCSACNALKKEFQNPNDDIDKLSKHFVLVNLEDDEEPREEKYGPDGKYIPRILFLHSDGEPDVDIQNVEGNPNYVYFYSQASEVTASMKEALRKMPPKDYSPHTTEL
ncbi:thioredoxin domain-containing protein 12-like [Sycon ciliatum]|uniref:thioredoxin domain-containing protein 12-like n=1 Tax=Sycon ciliatum TaxID=27933 RepID=UPI0031F6F71D|eukprot:scpid95935/ scgid10873/ Thioredoxin domain-containing protein 12; Endoplasmic reticulum resident protein 19; Thioredoxin-like protein p19